MSNRIRLHSTGTRVERRIATSNETEEWLTAFEQVVEIEGRDGPASCSRSCSRRGMRRTSSSPSPATPPTSTPSPPARQPAYAGDRDIERRIKSIVRWNAMAMVVRANKKSAGLGGHISTFASSATLYQVGFHHFFRGRGESGFDGDMVYFQGHASPGIYAHAFLEGRISTEQTGQLPPRAGAGAAACPPIRTPG